MTDRKPQDGNFMTGKAHANDNEPPEDDSTYRDKVTYPSDRPDDGENVTKPNKAKIKVSFKDWPDTLPVLPEELALIEAYMPDLISAIVANDN